ncbi:MAG: hypothetical protein B7Z68_07255 [Acidobacteria bacterium 21-70-11]|nr:MAG: hypothetical protein B7Z68_07255 [Acidobacteria bacterium 21-70-11]OYW05354.1 MAG: hypothetical protein B7Z61_06515 [Acidobacteria bacterium 37-71-11]HQT95221.1 DUF5946 family protein [Thermoanaerobaculaceae bacterium]
MADGLIRCVGCGALVRAVSGKPHPYIGAVAGCWEVYEGILAREFGEFGYPQPTHRLTVDTYAVQHPGAPGRQAIQSVNAHLVGLYLVLERGLRGQAATRVLRAVVRHADRFAWLEPPERNGAITVVDVARARGLEEHVRLVSDWARDVWSAWAQYHALIKGLAEEYL